MERNPIMKKYMSIKPITNLPSGLWLVLILLLGITHTSFAATRTWTGGSSSSSDWGYYANWQNGNIPQEGDDIVFPSGVSRLTNRNTFIGRTFHSIRFTGTGYKITGNKISLSNGIIADTSNTSNTLELAIDLTANQRFSCNNGGGSKLFVNGSLNLNNYTLQTWGVGEKHLGGIISGSGGITKAGSGPLIFSGAENTFTGDTIVNRGILKLAGIRVIRDGTLQIGDKSGEKESAIVRFTAQNPIHLNADIVINSDGLLDANNYSDDVGNISMHQGSIKTGTGKLMLYNDVSATKTPGSTATWDAKIYGNIQLAGTRTVSVAQSTDLITLAKITGTGGLTKTGAGRLMLYGSNTYAGKTSINEGTVVAANSNALGGTTEGTTVASDAILYLYNTDVEDESLVLNDNAHFTGYGPSSWAGSITLIGSSKFYTYTDAVFDLKGVISGSGGFTKRGSGDLVLSGTAQNTYTGATVVKDGDLKLHKTASGGNAIQYGSLTIGDGTGSSKSAKVIELHSYQIGDIDVTVNSDGYFNLNNFSDRIGTHLILNNGGDVATGSGTLSLSLGNQIIVTSTTGGDTSTISGKINLMSFSTTIDLRKGHLSFDARASGSSNIQVITPEDSYGNLFLNASNSFTGTLTLKDNSFVILNHSSGLGTTDGNTVVQDSAMLTLVSGLNVHEPLTLNSDATTALRIGVGSATWSGPIVLQRNIYIDSYSASPSSIILAGPISGSGGLTVSRSGTDSDFKLVLSGAGNSYTGDTIVNRGVLELARVNVIRDGILQIGDKVGLKESAIVRFTTNGPIHSDANIVINSDGLLHANNHSDGIGAILLDKGTIKTGTGMLTLFNNVNVVKTVGSTATWLPHIYGNINLSGTHTVTVTNSADLIVEAKISGSGSIRKLGQGRLRLHGANTYTGITSINEGMLLANNDNAFGSTGAGTVVANGGELYLLGCQIGNEALTLQDGSILSAGGSTNGWAGAITLNGASKFLVGPTDVLNLSGVISGAGDVLIEHRPYSGAGTGTVIYSGTIANAYTGDTTVKDGTLQLSKTVVNGGIQGNLIIGDNVGAADSSVVRLNNTFQIKNISRITIHTDGLFNLNGIGEAFGSLAGVGHVTLGGSANISFLDNTSSLFSGLIEGTGGITKNGSGTFTLSGNNTYSGKTSVKKGKMIINGQQSSSAVTIDPSGTLGGTGTVSSIVCGGIIEPGNSIGKLVSLGATTITNSSTLKVQLPSKNNYDQLEVNGALVLEGSPELDLAWGFTPEKGDEFIIIHCTSSEVGTFNGLTNGATLSVNGVDAKISYAGGASGRDVVLLVTGGDALTPFRILSINAEAGELVWDGPKTYSCIVEHKLSLTNASWTAVSTSSSNKTVVIDVDDDQGFFRVRKD